MAAETRTLWFGLKVSGFKVNSKFVQGQSTDQLSSLLSKEVSDDFIVKKVSATKSCSDENNNTIHCDISRAGTIQSLSVHYRYRRQPIRIDMVIMLYRYR